jgi:hypothetical protein
MIPLRVFSHRLTPAARIVGVVKDTTLFVKDTAVFTNGTTRVVAIRAGSKFYLTNTTTK